MSLKYGKSDWSVCICQTHTGDTPTGEYIYVLANQVRFGCRYMARIGTMAGGASYSTKNGKRQQTVDIVKGLVVADGTPTDAGNYTDLNLITNFFMDRHKLGVSPFFIFLKRGSVYKQFHDSSGTPRNWLEGYTPSWDVEDKGYGQVSIRLKFVECSL